MSCNDAKGDYRCLFELFCVLLVVCSLFLMCRIILYQTFSIAIKVIAMSCNDVTGVKCCGIYYSAEAI